MDESRDLSVSLKLAVPVWPGQHPSRCADLALASGAAMMQFCAVRYVLSYRSGGASMFNRCVGVGCEDDRMPLAIDCVLIDCVDLVAMTTFWCKALDLEHVWTGPSGGHLLAAVDGSGRRLGLMRSIAEKTAKNRVHFDLRPDDQEAEVRRLEGLGALRVDIGQAHVTWVVMTDPEGNEFCVLRSLADKEKDRARHCDW